MEQLTPLEQQSVEALNQLLRYYLSGTRWKDNRGKILQILDILAQRENNSHTNLHSYQE